MPCRENRKCKLLKQKQVQCEEQMKRKKHVGLLQQKTEMYDSVACLAS